MNIYISGLNFSTTDADLNDLFSEYGAAGQKAIDELNGAEFDHKQISVNVARPREERPSNGGNRDRRGGYNSRRY